MGLIFIFAHYPANSQAQQTIPATSSVIYQEIEHRPEHFELLITSYDFVEAKMRHDVALAQQNQTEEGALTLEQWQEWFSPYLERFDALHLWLYAEFLFIQGETEEAYRYSVLASFATEIEYRTCDNRLGINGQTAVQQYMARYPHIAQQHIRQQWIKQSIVSSVLLLDRYLSRQRYLGGSTCFRANYVSQLLDNNIRDATLILAVRGEPRHILSAQRQELNVIKQRLNYDQLYREMDLDFIWQMLQEE